MITANNASDFTSIAPGILSLRARCSVPCLPVVYGFSIWNKLWLSVLLVITISRPPLPW